MPEANQHSERTPQEILATGAAWVTETELQRLVEQHAKAEQDAETLSDLADALRAERDEAIRQAQADYAELRGHKVELAERLEVEMGAAKIALTEAARQIEAAEAQRDELVDALERTLHELDQWVFADGSAVYRVERAEKIARAALAKVRPPSDDPFLPIGHPTC